MIDPATAGQRQPLDRLPAQLGIACPFGLAHVGEAGGADETAARIVVETETVDPVGTNLGADRELPRGAGRNAVLHTLLKSAQRALNGCI